MASINLGTQSNKGAINLNTPIPAVSTVNKPAPKISIGGQATIGGNPAPGVKAGILQTLSGANAIGIKTQNPTDNIQTPANTTNQPKKQTPGSTQSTENGTNGSVPAYGSPVKDPKTGQVIGMAQFDPNTGKPLVNPNASTSDTTKTQTPAYTPSTGLFGQLVADLANRSTASGKDYNEAQAEANKIQDESGKYAQDYAEKTKNIAGTAGFLTQQTGLQGQLNTQYNTVQSNLANQYAGATNRIAAANTQQGLLNTALTNAAGYAAPTYPALTTQPYNPVNNTYGGGGASGALDRAKLAGQIDATQTTASNQGQTVQAYTSALQQGQNLQAQLSDLITTFGLNPSDLNKANAGLQLIAKNTSDPHYKQLENYVNDIANTYAQILTPPGGSQTDTSRGIATSMLDATASGSSLLETMRSLDNAAKAKIAGVPTANNGTGGGGNVSTGPISWADL